jgi:pyruvate,water dikinase
VASGPVRIVLTQEQASEFRAGEVLVIRAASPMFTPLMLLAAGLVVEIGGGASHSSLIARELGLPTVVKAEQATQILENGQQVQVNGEIGEVSILAD